MRPLKLSLLAVLLIVITSLATPFFLTAHKLTPHTAQLKPKAATFISNQPNVPAIGSLKFGMYVESKTPGSIEQAIGHKLNIIGLFTHFNQNLGNDKLSYACNQGYVPLVTWESWEGPKHWNHGDPYPLKKIASGDLDMILKQNLQAVADICKQQTVIIRFDQEFDTNPGVVSYAPWQGDPQAYIAAWQHIVSLSRSIDPNIKWDWSPNRSTVISRLYYPGDEWVDYVGLTLNRNGAVLRQPSPPATFADFYTHNNTIEQYHKPVIIGETTATEDKDSPSFKADWIRGMFSFCRQDKNIVAVVWFGIGTGYQYNTSPAAVTAFKDSL